MAELARGISKAAISPVWKKGDVDLSGDLLLFTGFDEVSLHLTLNCTWFIKCLANTGRNFGTEMNGATG